MPVCAGSCDPCRTHGIAHPPTVLFDPAHPSHHLVDRLGHPPWIIKPCRGAPLALLPVVMVGAACGAAVFERVDRARLRGAVNTLLVVMAVVIVVTAPR